jgi:hypothetical protein
MPDDSFSLTDLGLTIAKLLGLRFGEDIIEIQRNRLDPNELKIIRHPRS